MSRMWIPEDEENKFTYPLIQQMEQVKVFLRTKSDRLSHFEEKNKQIDLMVSRIDNRFAFFRSSPIKLIKFEVIQSMNNSKSDLIRTKNSHLATMSILKREITANKQQITKLKIEIANNRTKVFRIY